MPTPLASPPPTSLADQSAAARAHAEAMHGDYSLARGKGVTGPHIEARKRVATLFCDMHLPHDSPAERQARLAAIDYKAPVFATNARGVDLTKSKAFLGIGRKKAYLISTAYPPKTPEDPIHALEYTPVKP